MIESHPLKSWTWLILCFAIIKGIIIMMMIIMTFMFIITRGQDNRTFRLSHELPKGLSKSFVLWFKDPLNVFNQKQRHLNVLWMSINTQLCSFFHPFDVLLSFLLSVRGVRWFTKTGPMAHCLMRMKARTGGFFRLHNAVRLGRFPRNFHEDFPGPVLTGIDFQDLVA
jgi:hypothetical protein